MKRKKLLSIIIGSAIFSVVVVVIVVPSVVLARHHKQKKESVVDALKKFDANHSLNIKYVTDQDSSKPATTAVLRTALTARDQTIFTSEVVKNITFKGQLTVGGRAKVSATYNKQKVDIFIQEGSKPTPVIDALRKITQTNPLNIKYVTDQDSSNSQTTTVLRKALQKQSKVFTSEVVQNITFHGQLTAGKTATITATYNKQEVAISVKEESKTPVIDALHKITQTNPLPIKYVTDQDSSKPTTTAVLRDALQKQSKVFTSGVVAKITFKGQLTAGKTATITATYNSQGVDIFVQEGSKPTPVIDALHKITQTNLLPIKYVTDQDSSKPATTAVLRTALTARDKTIFTSEVVKNITFKGQLTVGGRAKVSATYNKQKVDIFVKEMSIQDSRLFILKSFTKDSPMKIRYIVDQNASSKRTEIVIYKFLVDNYPAIFGDDLHIEPFPLSGILQPGHVSKVKTVFSGTPVSFYVSEKSKNIPDIIRQFNNYFAPLKVKKKGEEEVDSSFPEITHLLQGLMVKQDISKTLTAEIVKAISFKGTFGPKLGTYYEIFAIYHKEWITISIQLVETTKIL